MAVLQERLAVAEVTTGYAVPRKVTTGYAVGPPRGDY